jgi:hypothetical protein
MRGWQDPSAEDDWRTMKKWILGIVAVVAVSMGTTGLICLAVGLVLGLPVWLPVVFVNWNEAATARKASRGDKAGLGVDGVDVDLVVEHPLPRRGERPVL